MKRFWLVFACFLAGSVSAHAQAPWWEFSFWDLDRLFQAEPAHPISPDDQTLPPTKKSTFEQMEQQVYTPEIWRLPPVAPPAAVPAALNVPSAGLLATPPPEKEKSDQQKPAASDLPTGDETLSLQPEPLKLWDGSFDLGMDGSEGNSETFNLHVGFHANRKTERNVVTLGLDYNRQTAKTVATMNRLYFDGRAERLIASSRWSVFAHETIEYDEFQSFDVRDTSDLGVGYRILRNDTTTLIGRFGGGFSHEYGGPQNGEYVPEVVFGMQLERQISKRQKLLGSVEYAPDVGDFLRYRIRAQAALDVLLDAEKNLNLRLGVLERYNSLPDDARPNDLDYAMMLLWKF